jgi:hypothetical protein
LVQRVTQQLVLVLQQLKFRQQPLRLIQSFLLLLFSQEPSSQLLFSQPSSLALHRHLLRWLLLVQPSLRPSLPALALQVEHRASNHHVQHEHERGRLVDR